MPFGELSRIHGCPVACMQRSGMLCYWGSSRLHEIFHKVRHFAYSVYPINATIQGSGVGAIRHCNFTTGSFVEPITVWNEPELLAFSVTQQPAPMTELSFWDIDAPHLHDYFVSERGQFKLTPLPGGKTLLQGSTWYTHKIQPAFYWSLWGEYIVHRIHLRVLKHIRREAEKAETDLNLK